MAKLIMDIGGMSCGHCVKAVERALSKVAGVKVESVKVGSAVASFDEVTATRAQIEAAVANEGYTVVAVESV